ncbi:hypothetical protein TURU_111905 [Turdus rufiventris]|nr:hypothetical protein TURU_111905 [Turdus rufiventris]
MGSRATWMGGRSGPMQMYEGQPSTVQGPTCGLDNPRHTYSLGREETESSTPSKDSGVMVDEQLNMSWQCVLADQKTKEILGCIQKNVASKSREVIPLLFTCEIPTWSPASSSGVPNIRRTWNCWSKSR